MMMPQDKWGRPWTSLLFESFVDKSWNNYSAGSYVTVDEMLETFRGRLLFLAAYKENQKVWVDFVCFSGCHNVLYK